MNPASRRVSERTRQQIMAAARQVVGRHGLAATMEDVALHAGVGMGTLYRCVGTKEALVADILRAEADRLAASARRALRMPSGHDALRQWMAETCAWQVVNWTFLRVLVARDAGEGAAKLPAARLDDLIGALVRRGQRAGEVRDDIVASDILMILLGTALVNRGAGGVVAGYGERFLALQLDALRPGASRPLPGRGLDHDELEQALRALASSPARS